MLLGIGNGFEDESAATGIPQSGLGPDPTEVTGLDGDGIAGDPKA